jgi:hypothetical protein
MSAPILAIDPGPKESAWVALDGDYVTGAFEPNAEVLRKLRGRLFVTTPRVCVIEMLAGSYGQAVGIETMETAVAVGRFAEAWERAEDVGAVLVFRKTAVAYVTGNPRANDSHVRQALVDRWGGDSVALAQPRRCAACCGKGQERSTVPCGLCAGIGQVMGVRELKQCPTCRGRGQAPVLIPCAGCGATGRVGADGPLRGISGHCWSALAVAVTAQGRATP